MEYDSSLKSIYDLYFDREYERSKELLLSRLASDPDDHNARCLLCYVDFHLLDDDANVQDWRDRRGQVVQEILIQEPTLPMALLLASESLFNKNNVKAKKYAEEAVKGFQEQLAKGYEERYIKGFLYEAQSRLDQFERQFSKNTRASRAQSNKP